MFGLNIDPNNPKGNPDPSELRELGVEMVRYTFYDSSGGNQIDSNKAQFYKERARAYDQVGIRSLVILTYDTFPNKPGPDAPVAEWDSYIGRFARRSGQIAELLAEWQPAFQIWNEPDHPPKGDYVPTVREEVFGRMMRSTYDAIKNVSPNAKVLTAGLAAGDPSWLTRAIKAMPGGFPSDMIVAFHPYGQRPAATWPRPDWGFGYVGNLLNSYYRAGQRHPLWISEIGIRIGDVNNDPNMAAEFLRRYYRTMSTHYNDKVEELFWFCYSDGMVVPFGLVDGAGNRKPMYNAFREVAAAGTPARREPARTMTAPPPPPAPPPPTRQPTTPPVTSRPTTAAPTSSTGTKKKSVIEEIDDLKQATAGFQGQIQQLLDQMNQIQGQLQQWQSQMSQVQSQFQQLSSQQSQLQSQIQQLQSQPATQPTTGVTTPPTPPPPTQPDPGPSTRPAPPIENIGQQLKHHPTLRFETRPLNRIQRIIVHHTAIPPHIGAERIANYGVDKKDWPAIKYHYFITGDGRIQQTNELTTLSTHAGPYSPDSVGIGFAGDFTNAIPTPAQMDAGAQLIAWLLRRFNLQIQAVIGYKELINTQSPGLQWDSGARWGDTLKEKVQSYL